MTRRAKALVFSHFLFFGILVFCNNASAAPPWVDRRLTLPKLNVAIDGALAVGHFDFGPTPRGENSGTGPALDLEAYVSVIRHLQLGFRQGIRLTDEAKIARADDYGRMYDLQGFGNGGDTFANPEANVRYQFIDTEIFELGVDGRLVLPFAQGSRFAFLAGAPIAIHVPEILRIDTGGYIGFGFYDPTLVYFHIPADLWVQLSEHFWLGPVTGLTVYNVRNNNVTNEQTNLSLGFGLGYQVTSWFDLRFLPIDWPAINQDRGVSNFGFSAGVEFRIE